jgi:hypothetical protein
VAHETLFQLLPEDGCPMPQEEVLAALSLRMGCTLTASDIDQLIWKLTSRVAWDAQWKALRRVLETPPLPAVISCERDLEPWFERYLFRLAADEFFEPRPPSLNIVVQNTARRAGNEGRFTKPDICMACASRYHYTPGVWFDLFAFELKLQTDFNIPSVMQALANAAFAHFTYLVVHLPEGTAPRYISAIRTRAIQHGVGIIRISDHTRDDGYQILLPGRRHTPRPGDTETFIEDRFEEANRNALRNWVRS